MRWVLDKIGSHYPVSLDKHPSVSWPCWIFNMLEELKGLMEWKQSSEMFNLTCLKMGTILVFLKEYQKKNKVRVKLWEITDALWFYGFLPFGSPVSLPALLSREWHNETKKMWFQTKQNGNKATYLTTFNLFHVQTPLIKAPPISIPNKVAHNQHCREYCAAGHVTPPTHTPLPPPLLNTGTGKALWLLSKGTSKSEYVRSHA